ncbi:MAG: addiction module protein [Thermodesulfobacteriota bacterium]|nr:addiction module protein [Thermodesulfobacteriota bacterium]
MGFRIGVVIAHIRPGKAFGNPQISKQESNRFCHTQATLSIDVSIAQLDDIWTDEAERRLKAYREGRLEGIPMEEIFEE